MAQCKCGQASPPWLTPQNKGEIGALILQMRKRVAGWHLSVQPQKFGSQHLLMEWAIFSQMTPEITLALLRLAFA